MLRRQSLLVSLSTMSSSPSDSTTALATFVEQLNLFFGWTSGLLWGPWLLILLIGTHIYLTFRLRIIQRWRGSSCYCRWSGGYFLDVDYRSVRDRDQVCRGTPFGALPS